MKIEIDGSRVGSAARTAVTHLVALLRWTVDAVRSLASIAGAWARRILRAIRSWARTAVKRGLSWARASRRWSRSRIRGARRRGEAFLTGPTVRGAVRTGWRGLVGRRADVSIAAALLAPLLALAANWWTVRTVGYLRIRSWVVGTWTGAEPQPIVFLAVAVLVALTAASAAVNSGVIPSTALAMGPVFGVAFARYGLTLQYYGTVGLADATAIGLGLAAAYGIPIGCAGFVLGSAIRRVASTLRGRGAPTADGVR